MMPVCALLLVACSDKTSSVVVELSSDLRIGAEANVLVARVMNGDVPLAEESYLLGEPPLHTWPQTLPIIAKSPPDAALKVEAELRLSLTDMPSIAVGFGQAQTELQPGGDLRVSLFIERNCDDNDGDGFGVGFGCERPDCDDNDERVPRDEICPEFRVPDAGVDAGTPDANRPDVGVFDGGADAGVFDSGAPDAGGEPCGQEVCSADQRCLGGRCRKRCQTTPDCESVYLSCLQTFNVCICRVPCADPRTNMCGPFACVDGCCAL